MTNQQLYANKVREKVGIAQSELRTYVYVRAQPAFKAGGHGLGSGCVAGALVSFAILSLLAKTHRALSKPGAFTPSGSPAMSNTCPHTKRRCARLHETNEATAFSSFAKWLKAKGLELGVTGDAAVNAWNVYRNWLMHRFDTSHLLVTFLYNVEFNTTSEADEQIEAVVGRGACPFAATEGGRLEFNVDVFYGLLPRIETTMLDLINGTNTEPAAAILNDLLLGLAGQDVDPDDALGQSA